MEKFIIGLFTQQLETYIEGFRKEQVTANLLNGKGEISHVQIKVKPVNDILKRFTPLVELSSVYISKLSFNVTSLRKIKKAPIEIYIDEIHVVLVEPLEYTGPNDASWPILAKSIVEKAKKKGPYGLLERIQDNITLDINRIYLTFQPMGKFKTRKIGKWTPPAISVVLNYLRFVSIDEYGDEASPDDVWRHNTRMGREEALLRKQILGLQVRHKDDRRFWHRTLMIYKKLTLEMSVAIGYRTRNDVSAKDSFQSGHLLLANVPLQSHICIHRRVPNNTVLAVQIDVSIMKIELDLFVHVIPLLIHALVGIQNCFKKQSFKDPFEQRKADAVSQVGGTSMMKSKTTNVHVDDDTIQLTANNNIDFSSEESDSEVSMGFDDEEEEDEEDSVGVNELPTNVHDDSNTWPALVLQAGLIIMEKIGFSFSVHHMDLRLHYVGQIGGYVQVSTRGLVSEVIWPKSRDGSLGGYVQVSLAYVNIQEHIGQTTKRILQGGHQICSDGTSTKETTSEEMFPMFEEALIRIDPDNLRCTFPVQVFGLKVSIDLVGKELMIGPTSELSITNEIGINDVNITFLPAVMIQLQQLVVQGSRDIDQRWLSGDWGNEADMDDIDRYIYIPPSGDGLFSRISPKNVNITARLSDIKIVIPPMEESDEHNCLLFTIPDLTFLVSSSLPRTFLSEDIPTTDLDMATTLFPNESIDFVYKSDSLLSQVARLQLTLNGASVKVFSPAFSHDASRVEEMLSLPKLVILASFENSEHPIRGALKHVFMSFFCHEIKLHIDMDLVSTALVILLSYRSFVENSLASQCNSLSAFNLTTRLSATDITLTLLTSNDGICEEDKLPNYCTTTPALNLRLDGTEICFQMFLSGIDAPSCIFFKGRLAKAQLQQTRTIQNDDILCFGVSFRFEVDSLGVLKGSAAISDGDVFLSQNSFDAFSSMMAHFDQEGVLCHVKELIAPKDGSELDSRLQVVSRLVDTLLAELKFMIATIQVKKVKLNIQDTMTHKNHSVILDELALQIGYRASKDVTQTYQHIWNEFYRDQIPGFHYRFLSRIKCISCENKMNATELGIVSFDGYLHPSKFQWEIQDCTINFDELSLLNEWKELLLKTHERIQVLSGNITEIIISQRDKFMHRLSSSGIDRGHSPLLQLFDALIVNLSRVRCQLREAKSKINETLLTQNRAALDFKSEVERLHTLLLRSELRRFAALSSVSHEMSGFLRVSSTTISGQRFVSATSFWNYYVILRKSYLIILRDTTHENPLAIIHLDGSLIRSVTGSGARHIFSKAFAVVENNGKETFFLAPSFADAERWIRALHSKTAQVTSQPGIELLSQDDSKRNLKDKLPVQENADMDPMLSSSTYMDLIEHKSSTDSYAASDNISYFLSEEETDDVMSRVSKGSKFRDRMAKLKTSVKNNVRSMNENVKSIKLDRSGNTVFSRSHVSSSSGGARTSNELPFKLRHVRATQEEPQIKDHIKIPREQKLLVLPGIWKCDVSVARNALGSVDHGDLAEQQSLSHDLQFTIGLSREVLSMEPGKTRKVVLKSFSEVLLFHTRVLTTITTLEKDPRAADINIPNGGSISDQEVFLHAISCGKALQGLLELAGQSDGFFFKYLDVVTSEFLDALFSSPIPTMVYNMLVDFFDLGTWVPEVAKMSTPKENAKTEIEHGSNHNDIENISKMMLDCDIKLKKSEKQIHCASKLASILHRQSQLSNDQHLPRSFVSSRQTNNITMDKFKALMAERDAMHSSLVASRVLHAHEMDLERKRFRRLESKLKSIEELGDRNSAPGAVFFLGQPSIPDINSLKKNDRDMIQDVEMELSALCNQLSSAISSRVSAELEITRMTELQQAQDVILNNEISQLKEELLLTKKKAHEESAKRKAAELECQKWKESFEALLHSSTNTS